MNATLTNGRAERKSLASQLDRLDGILDALADGLNQAVERAVELAAERAVANALARNLQNAPVTTQATKPGFLTRLAKWTWTAPRRKAQASCSRRIRRPAGASAK